VPSCEEKKAARGGKKDILFPIREKRIKKKRGINPQQLDY